MNAVGVLQNSKVETFEFDIRSFVAHLPPGIINGFPYKIYGYCVTFHDIPIRYVTVCLLDESDQYIKEWPKKMYTLFLINIFGINLNEISISG